MKHFFTWVLIGVVIVLAIAGCCGYNVALAETTNRTFGIDKAFISLVASYNISEDGTNIGTISGNYFTTFGDEFTYRDANTSTISSEREIKKWARLSINRLAEVCDANGNVMGYIGEDKVQSLFSFGYRFFFYDAQGNEIAHTKQAVMSLLSKQKVYDNNGEEIAKIEENFNLLWDSYTVTVYKDTLPIDQILFFACITDAISAKGDD